jgi:hypothetical protein
MPKFKIACEWTMIDEFDVEADTLEEAILKVEENENNAFPLKGEYLDDSFQINRDVTAELNDGD